MKRMMIVIILLLAIFAIASPLAAKGTPYEVVITGPGIEGEIVVRDSMRVKYLGITGLMVVPDSIDDPAPTGPAYTLIRDGWDVAQYYPDLAGWPGYVFYVGLINGWSEYDGRWFAATPEGDAQMRAVLAMQGITFDAAGYHVVTPSQVRPLLPFQRHEAL